MQINSLKNFNEIYYDYWNYKGHQYSQCHYNETLKNIYINIPKNASTNVRAAINNKGFYGVNLLESKSFPVYESAVVILRDPIKRWISGISTYLNLYHMQIKNSSEDFLPDLRNNGKWFFELLFERVSFDDHTEKQTYFLKPFDLSNAFYFYADDMDVLEYKLTHYYLGEGLNIKFDPDMRNINKENPIHQFFTEFLFDSKNAGYKEKLLQYYKEDVELINTVKFYGS
jgi:hypothetical protein